MRTRGSTVLFARFGLKHRGYYCCLPGYMFCDGRPPPGRKRPRHIAERALSLVACATGGSADASGRLEASEDAHAYAQQTLPEGRTYIGIAPGSRQANKNWPIERFCQVAEALAAKGLSPVIFLGPQEHATEAEIVAAAPGARVLRADPNISAGDGLDRLIAQGQRLALLLANDNGVGHLMGAAGVPVVSLFGPTDPARWRPVTPMGRVLRAQDFGGTADITAIPAVAVTDAVLKTLAHLAEPPR
jgi:ADP-heptose:LPS heptosyltransferase